MQRLISATAFNIICGGANKGIFLPANAAIPGPALRLQLKPRQKDAIETWQKALYYLYMLKAPTGFGKSVISMAFACWLLKKHPQLRCIFSVPQSVIAAGFRVIPALLDGEDSGAIPDSQFLCVDKENRTQDLLKLLDIPKDGEPPEERCWVCSHALLINAFLDSDQRKLKNQKLLQNLFLWVDEGQHSAGEAEKAEANCLGKIVSAMCEIPSAHVGLMSAAFQRGDRRLNIPEKYVDHFSTYELPYDVYLHEMVNLKNFRVTFVYHEKSYVQTIIDLLKENKRKGLIFLPSQNKAVSTGDKIQDIEAILTALGAGEPDSDGIQTLADGRRVMNLVDDTLRAQQKRLLDKIENGKKVINLHKEKIDLLFCVSMCKEGFDWAHPQMIIQVGVQQNGISPQIQIFGRLLRDTAGRPEVESIILLPAMSAVVEEDHDKLLNQYMIAIYMAMILEEIYDPIEIFEEESEREGKSIKRIHPLSYLPAGVHLELLLEEATAVILKYNKPPHNMTGFALWSAFHSEMGEYLKDYIGVGNAVHRKQITTKLWAMHCRSQLISQDQQVTSVKMNVLTTVDPIISLEARCSETLKLGKSLFGRLRDKLTERILPFEQFARIVKESDVCHPADYKYLRRRYPLLPANPTKAYPGKFTTWEDFCDLWEKKIKDSKKLLSSRPTIYAK